MYYAGLHERYGDIVRIGKLLPSLVYVVVLVTR